MTRIPLGHLLALALLGCHSERGAPTRRDVHAISAPGARVSGAIFVQGVDDAFAAVNEGVSRCARESALRGPSLDVHVHIAITGAVDGCGLPNSPSAPALTDCVCAVMRARRFPAPLGPPAPGLEVPPGHEAEYLVADATATYTITQTP